MDTKRVTLKERDAAVVFRDGGRIELILYDQAEGEKAFDANLNVGRVAVMLQCEDILAMVDERMTLALGLEKVTND